jgi:hypothetical protein
MIKLLIISNPQSPATDYYRTVGVFTRLRDDYPGQIELSIKSPEQLLWFDLYNCDIVIAQRPNGGQLIGYLQEAKAMGKKIIIDVDDLLHGIPQSNPAAKHFNQPDIQASIDKAFSIADHVIVSTNTLKDYYQKQAQGKITVIQNAYDAKQTPLQPITQQSSPARMLWRGSLTHLTDLHTIKDQINNLIKNKAFETVFVGLPPWAAYDFNERARFIEWQTFFSYFRLLRESRPDYGFFPLEITHFNWAKSNIFAIEMLWAGAVPIVPKGFPEFNIPGVLQYEDDRDFGRIIDRIASGKVNKVAQVNEAREWMIKNLSITQLNEYRLEIVNSLKP